MNHLSINLNQKRIPVSFQIIPKILKNYNNKKIKIRTSNYIKINRIIKINIRLQKI